VISLEHSETSELVALETILADKDEIKYNPFGPIPNEQIKKALKLIEEYSEELHPDIKGK